MTGDRARGAVLYATALALLAAGGVWWVRAEPRVVEDPRVVSWREAVVALLPETDDADALGTVALPANAEHDVFASVEAGAYTVTVACRGGDASRVMVTLGDQDSAAGLRCTEMAPMSFSVSTADQLAMHVAVTDAGPVVFRYAARRTS